MSNIRYYTDGEQATADTLNRPLKDLEKVSQYMSEPQFFALVENRRNIFAGSGQITDTKNLNIVKSVYHGGTAGITCPSPDWNKPNYIFFSDQNLKSTQGQYYFNIDGEQIKVMGTNSIEDNSEWGVSLPEAPTINGFETDVSSSAKAYQSGDFIHFDDNSDLLNVKEGTFNITDNSDGTFNIDSNDKTSYTSGGNIITDKLIPGVTYEVEYELVSYTSGGVYFYDRVSTGHAKHVAKELGTFSFKFTSETTSMQVRDFNPDTEIKIISFKQSAPALIVAYQDINIGDILNTTRAKQTVSRTDAVFIETWHELVQEKDIVYPLGNSQWTAGNTDGLSGITEGVFSGAETYSLFGNWQENGSLVGKGYVWSTLSQEDRLKFSSNKDNNVYMSKDGLVQVRYRVRVVKGFGNEWHTGSDRNKRFNYSTSQFDLYPGFTCLNSVLEPKGKLVISDDNTNSSLGHKIFYETSSLSHSTYTYIKNGYPGTLISPISNGYSSYDKSKTGKVKGVKLMLIQRKNQGAYEPTYNPEGCAIFSDGKKWFETSDSRSNIKDCFNNAFEGFIGSSSGRPDGEFFNEINHKDVEDLRMSALKITDTISYLNKEYDKLLTGDTRGQEILSNSLEDGEYYKFRVDSSCGEAGNVNGHLRIGMNVTPLEINIDGLTDIENIDSRSWYPGERDFKNALYFNDQGFILQGDNGKSMTVWGFNHLLNLISTYIWVDERNDKEWDKSAEFNGKFPVGTIVTAKKARSGLTQNKYILKCDIIGDPSNYPLIWNGNIPGEQLLKRERETSADKTSNYPTSYSISQIPSEVGISTDSKWKPFQLSRKFKSIKQVIVYKADGSIKEFDAGSNGGATIDGIDWRESSNEIFINWINFINNEDDVVIQVFYEAYADNFSNINSLTSKSNECIALGDVDMLSCYNEAYGSTIVSDLLRKSSTGGNGNNVRMPIIKKSKRYWENSQLNGGSDRLPEHETIPAIYDDGSFAVKTLPYLSRYGDAYSMNILFKEMKYNGISRGTPYWEYSSKDVNVNSDSSPLEIVVADGVGGYDNDYIITDANKFLQLEIYDIDNIGSFKIELEGYDANTSIDITSLFFQNSKKISSARYFAEIPLTMGSLKKIKITMTGTENIWIHSIAVINEKSNNNWGDDNKFQISTNANRRQNINDDEVIYGTKRMKLKNFISIEERVKW